MAYISNKEGILRIICLALLIVFLCGCQTVESKPIAIKPMSLIPTQEVQENTNIESNQYGGHVKKHKHKHKHHKRRLFHK